MIFERIKEYCRVNGLSIAKFEKKCGIGNGCIKRWEDGRVNPSMASLNKIAAATGIDISRWL